MNVVPEWRFNELGDACYDPCWVSEMRGDDVRINDNTLNVVTFLGILSDTGAFVPYGTGFTVAFEYNGMAVAYLVTAKHVIDDMQSTNRPRVCRVNAKDGSFKICGLGEK